jgi:hypothetical protein
MPKAIYALKLLSVSDCDDAPTIADEAVLMKLPTNNSTSLEAFLIVSSSATISCFTLAGTFAVDSMDLNGLFSLIFF